MDRNKKAFEKYFKLKKSPPARVAWIETFSSNSLNGKRLLSPPARVAWIETFVQSAHLPLPLVATREGGVDRNLNNQMAMKRHRRSPPARVAWIETWR